MKKASFILAGFSLMTFIFSSALGAQERPTVRPDTAEEWTVSLGGGFLFNPTYLGDDDYQLSLLPNIRVAYGNRFFASIQEGVGYNLFHSGGWRAGPLVKFDFGPDEGGNSPFRILGNETTDLDGFGEIDFTFEACGFVAYSTGAFRSKFEVRRGLNGHEGFVGDFEIARTGQNTLFGKRGIFSLGPTIKFANAR